MIRVESYIISEIFLCIQIVQHVKASIRVIMHSHKVSLPGVCGGLSRVVTGKWETDYDRAQEE